MNNDERAFLDTILANPDDDVSRLVYADWLEENSQAERAKFIRSQIYRTGERFPVRYLGIGVPFGNKHSSYFGKDHCTITEIDSFGYGGGVRQGPEANRVILRRGFVDRVRFTLQYWLVICTDLLQQHPVSFVEISYPIPLPISGQSSEEGPIYQFTYEGQGLGLGNLSGVFPSLETALQKMSDECISYARRKIEDERRRKRRS